MYTSGSTSGPICMIQRDIIHMSLYRCHHIRCTCPISTSVMVILTYDPSPTPPQKVGNSLGMSFCTCALSGIHCLMACCIMAELTTMVNKSGGEYAYVHMDLGKIYGFMRLFVDVSPHGRGRCSIA